jgi:hypothetical protein
VCLIYRKQESHFISGFSSRARLLAIVLREEKIAGDGGEKRIRVTARESVAL